MNGAASMKATYQGDNIEVGLEWPIGALAYNRLRAGLDTMGAFHGTLINSKQDGVGTLYRRNRHYDPSTGRFTQEDPIGLAGGLNLYGYANGDSINFSDPFGLCADSTKNKNGKCPRGLTERQWRRIEYAANNRMTAEARDQVLELLNAGEISPIDFLPRGRTADASPLLGNIRITERAFEYQIGDFVFLLTHEARHTGQLFMWPGSREADADAYGCANTWGRRGYRSGGYRGTHGPCGSGLP